MTAKQTAVKKYIVRLSDAGRERLKGLIQTGRHRARQVMKARILLKADTSEAPEAWTDSQIAEALDTSADTVARTRRQLVEEGLDAALSYKHSPNSARRRIFDGAAEARRLVERFEWRYTPEHGRLLDLAESELSVLSRQCLHRRIPDKPTLTEEVAAWEASRSKNHTKADWQFITADARVQLKRLYPVM